MKRHMGKAKSLSILMMIIMLLQVAVPLGIFAEEEGQKDYAEILFSNTPTEHNAKLKDGHGFKEKTVDGITGLQSAIQGAGYLHIDIDDEFMYDLPNETPVDITVEYYDEGGGTFSLIYDSYKPWDKLRPQYENNKVWAVAEIVQMTNTMKWKSYTFRLNDLKAANRSDYGTDFKISLYNLHNYVEWSRSDILFRSVKIEYGDKDKHISLNKFSSKYVGNIFSDKEDIVLNLDLSNNVTGDAVTGTIKYAVYNEEENSLVYECEEAIPVSFEAGEKKIQEIKFANPGKFALYRIDIEIESALKSNPTAKVRTTYSKKFSVATVMEEGWKNSTLGSMLHLGPKRRGDLDDCIEICTRAGISYIRDDNPNMSLVDGNYVVEDRCMQIYRKLKENNIEPFMIVSASAGRIVSWNYARFPQGKEELEEWGKYCYDLASYTKGVVKHFEIWNEPNVTTTRDAGSTPEAYVEMLKYAYTNIKKANPEAVVYGVCTTASRDGVYGYEPSLVKAVFENGGLDYMDYFTYHPYDWSHDFREDRFIDDANAIKQMMRDNGKEIPMFISEFGFSTDKPHTAFGTSHGYELDEQYQCLIRAYAIMKSYKLQDGMIQYALFNGPNEHEQEQNWGMLNWYYATDDAANTAKPSYIAMTNCWKLIGNATPDGNVREDRAFAFKFKNDEIGKDVVLVINGNDSTRMSINLGAKSATAYDKYGNYIGEIFSDNGIYEIEAVKDPFYLLGNFTALEKVEQKGSVTADAVVTEGGSGGTAIYTFTKTVDKNLKINVDGVEVAENNGFVGNTATLKVKVPSDGADKKFFYVTVTDDEGKVYYAYEHKINIVPPIKMVVETEMASALNKNRWRLKVTVENVTDTVYSGEIRVLEPEDAAKQNAVRSFTNLRPGKKFAFSFNIPEKVNKNVANAKVELTLDTGYKLESEMALAFTSAVYTDKKPNIDGVSETGEWIGSWITANQRTDVKQITGWDGEDDVSLSANLMWDEEYFYFLFNVRDDIHFVNHEPSGVENTWRGDGIQIGFDDRLTINSVVESTFTELSIGFVPGIGDVVYKSKALYDEGVGVGVLENAEIAIKRYDEYTIYECAVSWDDLFYEGYEVKPDAPFRFSAIANDNDGQGRRGWIAYTDGIGSPKSALMFGDMTFEK